MHRYIAINSYLFRRSVLANGLSEKTPGSLNVSMLANRKSMAFPFAPQPSHLLSRY
jgi:hypothetical protein